jgi:hypothetical protein
MTEKPKTLDQFERDRMFRSIGDFFDALTEVVKWGVTVAVRKLQEDEGKTLRRDHK